MDKGNVLVIGNSGVGKSTLINAVLGEDAEKKAVTGRGIKGTTTELEIYENNGISFRSAPSQGCLIKQVGILFCKGLTNQQIASLA